MPRIASVVFRGGGKVYQFDAGELELAPGDHVVVDTTRGADFGRARQRLRRRCRPTRRRAASSACVRKATQADLDAVASHREAEREAKRGVPRSSSPSSAST